MLNPEALRISSERPPLDLIQNLPVDEREELAALARSLPEGAEFAVFIDDQHVTFLAGVEASSLGPTVEVARKFAGKRGHLHQWSISGSRNPSAEITEMARQHPNPQAAFTGVAPNLQ